MTVNIRALMLISIFLGVLLQLEAVGDLRQRTILLYVPLALLVSCVASGYPSASS